MPHSILLLCPDYITERMAGPAIRYWEFAKSLAPLHAVTLAAPNQIPDCLQADMPARLVQHTPANIAELANSHDIIIFQGYILDQYPLLRQSNKILVADMYDPVPLEGLEQQKGQGAADVQAIAHQVRMMNDQLKLADYFLCANERQRDLWLGHLLALGRVNPLTYAQIQQRVVTVPFGLPDLPPRRTGVGLRQSSEDKDFILLWGGGIWEWFDPLTLIRAVHHLLPHYPKLKLVFLGTQHPNTTIQTMPMLHRAVALARELGLFDTRVIFQSGWVPYSILSNYLLDADVGVSAHFDTLETHFSFRTRILHYLWAGKPIITTQGDVLADAIVGAKAGIVLNPQDEQAWQVAIETLHNPIHYATYLAGVKMLASRYRWSTVTQPLQSLCANATLSPDMRIENGLRKSLHWDCEQEYQALKCYLDVIEHSNSWRITAPLRALRRWLMRVYKKGEG
jgi:glycosyltransferase involved in cell wall biosynthesis